MFVTVNCMLIRKAYKFALKPTPDQAKKLSQGSGCVRLVWNKALALQKDKLANKEKLFTYNELAGKLTEWKKTDGLLFLGDAQSQPLQQTLKDLDRAMKDGLKKEKGMPRFKKKDRVEDGMKFPQGFKISGRKLFIPKVGLVKTHMGRQIVGEMKNLTIKKEAGKWCASIQVESETEIKEHPKPFSMVGIDLGVKRFATLSNGAVVEPLSAYRKYEKKLAQAQVNLFRRVKGSQGRAEARLKVQKIHKKISRMRQDFLHKASHWIAKNHGIVVLEDLQIVNMSKSAKGTVEEPGRNVRAKAGLNKSILDQGWGEFKRQLEYKLAWFGGELHTVPAHYTSQACSECKHVDARNRPSQAKFQCISCGFECNADVNAARNIECKALGQRVLACESNRPSGRKQEPLRKRKVPLTISEPQSLDFKS